MAIVKDGRVLAIGPPRELRRRPAAGATTASPTATRDGELVERETDDPTRLLHELTGRGAGARASAARS